ncbi:hypothetical protein, conserved [Plasmodium gonderi]|uniref:Thioredoxin domain-containing protein n=1 Tax=Plasmodium gonderi TaxID=77519 RepID=A0A1Y1JSI7_PLAGO|nr:hypothetical protein, conserved [Plasmodium gonderi]GAW83393.1 hypothetical protein, conserved [Plasmodium gonderi]
MCGAVLVTQCVSAGCASKNCYKTSLSQLRKCQFSTFFEKHNNEDSKLFECKEINDYNYENIIKNRKTFLVYGYADYSYRCFTHFNKLIDVSNKHVEFSSDEKIPLYKLNISKNKLVVQNFHIKSIPIIQLRHKCKLVEELSGNELNDQINLSNMIKRSCSYFDSILDVKNIIDFLSREEELSNSGYLKFLNEEKFHNTFSSSKKTNDEVTRLLLSYPKKITNEEAHMEKTLSEKEKILHPQEMNNMSQEDTLKNLQLKYQCTTYINFKKLELLLSCEKKNANLIKYFLNEIILYHNSYLDISEEYSKIMAKGFLYLFDEENISFEYLIELKNKLLEKEYQSPMNLKGIKLINFNEPVITFDDFKNVHLKGLKKIDEFLSNEEADAQSDAETNAETNLESNLESNAETNAETNLESNLESNAETNVESNLESNAEAIAFSKNTILQTNSKEHKSDKMKNVTKSKYLSRIYRILAVKYLHIEDYDSTFHYALESYKLTFPLKNIETTKSKVLIENLILYVGAYNTSVINFLTNLQFLYTNKIFKVVRFPHTRAIKGGRPMMKRGKSGKWLWLSQDWKPRWLKKKSKLILEDEWKCVPDKNVPFWN